MDYNELIEWAFKGVVIWFLKSGLTQFKALKDSVIELNKQFAVLITKDKHKDKEFLKVWHSIERLEDKCLNKEH